MDAQDDCPPDRAQHRPLGLHVAPRSRGIWAFGPPPSGSAGCGLDRSL